MKLNRFFILVILLSLWTTVYSSGEIKKEEQAELLHDWCKIVIQDSKAFTIIPYRVGDNRLKNAISFKLPMLVIDLNKFSRKILIFNKQPINHKAYGGIVMNHQPVFREDNKCLPFAWDLNSSLYSYVNYFSFAGDYGIYFQMSCLQYYPKLESGYYKAFQRFYYHPKVVKSSKMFTDIVDGQKRYRYEYTYYDSIEGIYHRVISGKDNSTLLFLLNRNNVFVWKGSGDGAPSNSSDREMTDWNFQYAFKLPITKPFDVCLSGNTLYVMNKTTGTYKIDIQKAIEHSPKIEPPYDLVYGGGRALWFIDFAKEKFSENIIKAEKISDLKYDYYIDDKDNETGYIAVDNYMYKLSDLKTRTKIPEPKKKDTFVESQADRMYTALEAYLAFKTRYEKTPANLLKITPDIEVIDKPAPDPKAANPDVADPPENDTEDKKTEKEHEDENGIKNDTANNTTDAEDSELIEKSDLKSDDEADELNENDLETEENERRSSTDSNSSNVMFYAGGGFVLIVLIIMVLVLMPRKKN